MALARRVVALLSPGTQHPGPAPGPSMRTRLRKTSSYFNDLRAFGAKPPDAFRPTTVSSTVRRAAAIQSGPRSGMTILTDPVFAQGYCPNGYPHETCSLAGSASVASPGRPDEPSPIAVHCRGHIGPPAFRPLLPRDARLDGLRPKLTPPPNTNSPWPEMASDAG